MILSPTRELASQTERVLLAIGDYLNIQVHACIGGKSIGEDIRRLENGVHVVSGTPGRVCDMIKRRTLRTRAIKLLVLVGSLSYFLAPHLAISSRFTRLIPSIMQDEADEMLSRGFKDQIYDVYRYLPRTRTPGYSRTLCPLGKYAIRSMVYDQPIYLNFTMVSRAHVSSLLPINLSFFFSNNEQRKRTARHFIKIEKSTFV